MYRINKDESLPHLALPLRRNDVNTIFLKYSKEGRLSSSHIGIQNIPSDVYDDTKNYYIQSEHRRIQNSFKHLRWSVFLTDYGKTPHLRCLKGS